MTLLWDRRRNLTVILTINPEKMGGLINTNQQVVTKMVAKRFWRWNHKKTIFGCTEKVFLIKLIWGQKHTPTSTDYIDCSSSDKSIYSK